MNIIYISSVCSKKKYFEYVESRNMRISQQSQKYNYLLSEGFVKNGAEVKVLSSRPINRQLTKKIWFKDENEISDGINFHYLPFLNLPIFRSMFLFIYVFFNILIAKDNNFVVCDSLNIVSSFAALLASFFRRFKAIGIVTDVPCHRPKGGKPSLTERINLWIMTKFSAYLLLTEQMNNIVNPKNKPYIVLEGHADENMKLSKNTLNHKYNKKVCIYAGTLRRIYGIEYLVKGFISANIPDAELHIYGNGEYAETLRKIAKTNKNIVYHGVVSNEKVIEAELKATLLINPRPTHSDYVKYSFPSKNIEYMVSGTPILTTKLPGMPVEYEPYVYLIEQENIAGIKEALLKIFSQSPEEIHKKGLDAKEFILKEKNNIVQAKKVILNLLQ